MPLLNYTTKISAFTTVSEIQKILVAHGAKKIMQEFDDDGNIRSLTFMINTPGGLRSVRLPANSAAVYQVLQKQNVKCDMAQAERVAWRIIKDWVASQMAILESAMVSIDEIFLPYMVNNNGQTFFEVYQTKQNFLEE